MAAERLLSFKLNPNKPKLKLPSGSWDTHCHVLGPTEKYPYAATSTRSEERRVGKECRL